MPNHQKNFPNGTTEAVFPFIQRYTAWIIVFFLACATAMRLAWVATRGTLGNAEGEAANAAITLARTGIFADAYGEGSGPTAHLLPIPPGIAGGIYKIFGIQSTTSEFILLSLSTILVLSAFYFLYRAFAYLGVSTEARLLALGCLCLLPLNVHLETVYFRIWEGGYAAFMLALALLYTLRINALEQVSTRHIVTLSIIAAFSFFIHPAVGLAVYLNATLLGLRKLETRRWFSTVLIATLCLASLIIPWTIRNEAMLQKPIWLRDNFGLELSLAYFEGAADPETRHQAFVRRINEIHPYRSEQAFTHMIKAGGEASYAEELGRETKAWIREHPQESLSIALMNMRELLFPPAWKWTTFNGASSQTELKLFLTWFITGAGLIGLAIGLFQRRLQWDYVAIATLIPLLPYVLTFPIVRYRYPVWGLLTFLAFFLIIDIICRPLLQRLINARTSHLTTNESERIGRRPTVVNRKVTLPSLLYSGKMRGSESRDPHQGQDRLLTPSGCPNGPAPHRKAWKYLHSPVLFLLASSHFVSNLNGSSSGS